MVNLWLIPTDSSYMKSISGLRQLAQSVCDKICGAILSKLAAHNYDEQKVSTQSSMAIILLTSPLMWVYTLIAYLYIDHPLPYKIGLATSIVHLFCFYFLHIKWNTFQVTIIGLAAGLIHQANFSYFSGGFSSFTIVWFAVLPLLGGIMTGKRGALLWGSITTVASLIFFTLHLSHYPFPNLLSEAGAMYAKLSMLLGWIGLSTFLVVAHLHVQNNHKKQLIEKGVHIEQLLRVLYHDLATPLSTSMLNVEQIINKPNEEKNKLRLERIQKSIKNMLDITNNIRELQAIENNKKNLSLSKVELAEILNDLQIIFAEQLRQKQIDLIVENVTDFYQINDAANTSSIIPSNLHDAQIHDTKCIDGVIVLAEPISLKNQVLGNLISNAIKFSHANSVIRIQIAKQGDHTLIKVQDSGVGIPTALIPKLFSTNESTSRTGTSGEQGTGFGMPVVKSFIEIYGGKIYVESNENGPTRGTTFTVELKSAA